MARHIAGSAPVNGLNLYYEIHGDGPPLVVLPGATKRRRPIRRRLEPSSRR